MSQENNLIWLFYLREDETGKERLFIAPAYGNVETRLVKCLICQKQMSPDVVNNESSVVVYSDQFNDVVLVHNFCSDECQNEFSKHMENPLASWAEIANALSKALLAMYFQKTGRPSEPTTP